ncbi:hypothetical protein B0H15DRAFT_915636 [Mycena belliarum]|uniref:PH domain-containing protein n=1 Tax=Mycena belliarum TaxID=1033014 RepID=A0AAD6XK80_9AGAR|nr:hypothetical protein B0H15DRAFT_915636 [Mycena belliae]
MTSSRQAASPLRDRLLSNSPDPVKTKILRDSGMGWADNPASGSPNVSPLRISKRDSPVRKQGPADVARRTSSSFKHVRNNNLVSKSPFKSQIPTAATPTPMPRPFPSPTRRVSAEKRPRPQSLHDQAEAENDRPFAYKRERRQSKGFQGLIQMEPVTKSPFRQLGDNPAADHPPPPPVPPTPSRIPVPSGPSPARSSLVSKRMHGPRLSGRRERRKTVTFDERCDVVEFDRDEEDGVASDTADEYGDPDSDSDPFFAQPQQPPEPDSSYESVDLSDTSLLPDTPMPLDLDPDTSITGLVDAMFAGTSTPPLHGSSHTHFYEHEPEGDTYDHPTDLDTEDGVPFGRSHHVDRAAAFHAAQHADHPSPVPQPHLIATRPLPLPDMAVVNTPPRSHATGNLHTPPLGRTTHLERRRAAAEDDPAADDEVEADVAHLPGSPSPAPARVSDVVEIGVPRFALPNGMCELHCSITWNSPVQGGGDAGPDPFALPKLRDEPLPDVGEESCDVSMGRPELEVYFSRSEPERSFEEQHSPTGLGSSQNQGGSTARPRISREEVQRRLRARSTSPEVDQAPEESEGEEGQSRDDGSSRNADELMEDEDEFREEREAEARYEAQHEREEREASMSTEIGTVVAAEKQHVLHAPAHTLSTSVPAPTPQHDEEFGLRAPGLGLDFGSRFGLAGLGIAGLSGSVGSRMSAAARREPERMAVDMDMRSALDRLMDDVAGAGGSHGADESLRSEESAAMEDALPGAHAQHKHPVTRAATDSALLQMASVPAGAGLSRSVSIASSSSLLSLPPPLPPKDNIRSREATIIEKRRELRRFDEGDYDFAPTPTTSGQQSVGAGRPSARRSMSTGDAEELARLRNKGLLDVGAGSEDLLADSIEKELSKREEPNKRKQKYHIRQHEGTIYASSSDSDRIAHVAGAGDVDAGKAWKTVRRPSDMNEYSKQIKEYRAQQNPGKAYGKVFVKVLGVKGMHLPLPQEPTAITCTLNNGIHFVTTPECALRRDCSIEQEFELIEHSKLEFTLTLKVRRDPHIISQFKTMAPVPMHVPAPPPVVQQTSSKAGKRSFWSSSPKKSKDKDKVAPPPPAPSMAPAPTPQRLPENLARYLKPDGTLARAFIAFKDIAVRCDTRLFETNYPLIGQRAELGGKASTLQVGELVLQMFRLPPLPGIPPDQLPQSLEECHRGLRHINWHKVTYFQGTLTQNGGDCSTWRRRQLRVIGASLVAFNDVTKKVTATIDLKKAIAVEDDQEARGAMSPASALTARSSRHDEYDGLYGVERSFRLIFLNDQEIVFFADTDDEKAKWLEVLRALVGHIPPHPLWAELLWQRQEDLSKRARP